MHHSNVSLLILTLLLVALQEALPLPTHPDASIPLPLLPPWLIYCYLTRRVWSQIKQYNLLIFSHDIEGTGKV
jgi:hypothetical protein